MIILLTIIAILLAFLVMPDFMWSLTAGIGLLLIYAVILAIGAAILFAIFSAFA